MQRLKKDASILKIPQRSYMNKNQLKNSITICNSKGKQTGEDVYCSSCLTDQYKQRKLHQTDYYQSLLDCSIRQLKNADIVEMDDMYIHSTTGEIAGCVTEHSRYQ
jgi:predicted amidophosphoribosyltransferase